MKILKLACAALVALALLPQCSKADVSFRFREFTGSETHMTVHIADIIGGVTVAGVVHEAPNAGDLIGLFFSINPFTGALRFEHVSDLPITGSLIAQDSVNDLGGVNNVNPSPAASGGFDFAVAIGGPRVGDRPYTLFNILGDITPMSFTEAGARVVNVGLPGGNRTGSSMLFSDDPFIEPTEPEPLPEPSTYMLVASGLVLGAVIRRRSSKAKA